MSSTASVRTMSRRSTQRDPTLREDRDPKNWKLEGICATHELSKTFLKTQLRHLERTYEERLAELNTHEAPYEDERRQIIARRKWDKKTGRPKWYIWWEMFYMLWLWFSVSMAVVYLGFGFTIQAWTRSIQSIAVGETTYVEAATKGIQFIVPLRYYDMVEELSYHGKSQATYYIGTSVYLAFFSVWTIKSAGWKADWHWILYGLLHQSIVLGVELYIVNDAFSVIPKVCRPEVFRRVLFERYYRWYGILAIHKDSRGEEALDKIHYMQGALGCCGLNGYTDFYSIMATESDEGFNVTWWPETIGVRRLFERYDKNYYLKVGRDVRQIPHSCCKPIWRNNIYCADNIFHYDKTVLKDSGVSLAKERLNPRGCVEVVYDTCNFFRILVTYGMMYAVIFRAILYLLLVIFSPLIHKSLPWRMKWLWYITEGKDGMRYLPLVTHKKDIFFLALRQPHDRFDPRVYRWRDPDFVNLEVPRDGVPLPYLVKLDDLPSEAEFGRLNEIKASETPMALAAEYDAEERYFVNRPTAAYRGRREEFLRHSEQGSEIAEKLIRERDDAEIASRERAHFPGEVVTPSFRFYPARKTIHFKEKKKYNSNVPHPPPPMYVTDWDQETLQRQATVHIDTRFDWVSAIEQVKQEEAEQLLKIEKAREQRAIRNARVKGFDTTQPWLPIKKEVPLVTKPLIAADTDDEPPPMWDRRPSDEGSGGFLQPTQEHEIQRQKALEEGQAPPPPPKFFGKSSTVATPIGVSADKLVNLVWDAFPDKAKKKPPKFNLARKFSDDTPGMRMLRVLKAHEAKARDAKHAEIMARRREAIIASESTDKMVDELETKLSEKEAHRESVELTTSRRPAIYLAKKWIAHEHARKSTVNQETAPELPTVQEQEDTAHEPASVEVKPQKISVNVAPRRSVQSIVEPRQKRKTKKSEGNVPKSKKKTSVEVPVPLEVETVPEPKLAVTKKVGATRIPKPETQPRVIGPIEKGLIAAFDAEPTSAYLDKVLQRPKPKKAKPKKIADSDRPVQEEPPRKVSDALPIEPEPEVEPKPKRKKPAKQKTAITEKSKVIEEKTEAIKEKSEVIEQDVDYVSDSGGGEGEAQAQIPIPKKTKKRKAAIKVAIRRSVNSIPEDQRPKMKKRTRTQPRDISPDQDLPPLPKPRRRKPTRKIERKPVPIEQRTPWRL